MFANSDTPSAHASDEVPSDAAHLQSTWVIDPEPYSYKVSQSRWASFKYALAGWLYMLRYQKNTRIQAVVSVLVVALGLWLGLSTTQWAILILTIAIEWMAEFINAAIEAAVNLSGPAPHPMAKVSKDVAAAAVLLGAVTAAIVGVLILGPPLLARLEALFLL